MLVRRIAKQAGAEMGQAQLNLDWTLIFCRFGFSRFGSVYLVHYILNILLSRFDFLNLVLQVWLGLFGSIDLF